MSCRHLIRLEAALALIVVLSLFSASHVQAAPARMDAAPAPSMPLASPADFLLSALAELGQIWTNWLAAADSTETEKTIGSSIYCGGTASPSFCVPVPIDAGPHSGPDGTATGGGG